MRKAALGGMLVAIAFAWVVVPQPEVRAAPSTLYLMVHDSGTPNRVIQCIVSNTGVLTAGPGSPVDTLNTTINRTDDCQSMAYSARRRLLFTSGGEGISVIDLSTPTPTLVAGSPFSGKSLIGVAAVEKGPNTYVYGARTGQSWIEGFRVTEAKKLEPLPDFSGETGPYPIGICAVKDMVFAALDSSLRPSEIDAFKVGANGDLVHAPGAPVSLPGDIAATRVYNVDADPQGRFVYAADPVRGRVFGFRVNPRNAALTSLPRSPFEIDNLGSISSGLAFASASLLFALDQGLPAEGIQPIRKLGNGGLASPGRAQNSIVRPDTGAADSSGKFLAYADTFTDKIVNQAINKRTGGLTPRSEVTVPMHRPTAVLFVRR